MIKHCIDFAIIVWNNCRLNIKNYSILTHLKSCVVEF